MCTSDKDSAPQCNGSFFKQYADIIILYYTYYFSYNYNIMLSIIGINGNVSEILIGTLVGLGSLGVLIVITIAVIFIMKWKVSKRKTLYIILITRTMLVCMIDHSFPLYRFVHTTNRDTRDNQQVRIYTFSLLSSCHKS